MPRLKRTEGDKTSVEIIKIDVVKKKLISTKETLKEYINRLIRNDMMNAEESISIEYFKGYNQP